MASNITRRDLLNGIAVGAGGLMLPALGTTQTPADAARPQTAGAYYPPTQTGMRGSHDGSFEVAHDLAWRGVKPTSYEALEEHYDLVVVGAGMSGLAAAWYFRQLKGPEARILLLDNHDDFGGHAKRNEFHHEGRMVLSLGGAQNLENPSNYSSEAGDLLVGIGIDEAFLTKMAAQTPDGLALAGRLDANNGVAIPGPDGHFTMAGNWNGVMFAGEGYEEAVQTLPIAADEKERLIAFFGGGRDFLDGLSIREKWRYINNVSYNQFLLEKVGLADTTLPLLNAIIVHLTGMSGWNLTVLEAIGYGASGIRSMGWIGRSVAFAGGTFVDSLVNVQMFPDGNASVARLLVQNLIPAVAPDMQGPDDVVASRFDYAALDRVENTTRMRLNSTVVGVREQGDGLEVDYVEVATGGQPQRGQARRVTAEHCVLACNNNIIPHLCPELPQSQQQALRYGVRTPFVYANVLLANGRAYEQLGASLMQCPYDPFQWVSTAPTVSIGGYEPPRNADDPMVVFMMHSPMTGSKQSGSGRDQLRMGRQQIYMTPFETYEQQVRDQLQSLLGQFGFNHETDIQAITVNRIPHGYAYPYLALDDPEWEEGKAPHEIGRAQFGRISIANSDSQAIALMDAAFDAAWRAVQEQVG
ncbi:MAG: NAD(P)/FAD-dependent oxidoreductase [Gammaproteobacteria bacterium TMED243]|nr:Tat pathway signal protein [Gammaproteobacteria bacterium]RPG29696.1 MAG: NAD(P)/FAD-dependent oxidoreductase [Gammaproteobacteria bacterium TMED243]